MSHKEFSLGQGVNLNPKKGETLIQIKLMLKPILLYQQFNEHQQQVVWHL